ncbi:hypothetical protein KJZ99_04060 [bacterium]|nr:hypothetical protein [bacterium]
MMMPPNDYSTNGWGEWKNHVLIEIKRLADNQEAMREDIIALKTKAAVWGSVAAFVVTTLVNLAIGVLK